LNNPGHFEKKLQKSGTFKVLMHFNGFLRSNFPGQQRKSKNSALTAYRNPGQSRQKQSKWSFFCWCNKNGHFWLH